MHLIVNPTAGGGRGLRLLDAVIDLMRNADQPFTVMESRAPGHARDLARSVPVGATVVAVGGDGTVHELLPACLDRDLLLGVVPAGSGDDFAFALGLRRHDHAAAVAVLLAGRERRIDVGTVNGEPFVNAFGAGFDADVARRMSAAPAAFRGLARYLHGIATAMRDFRLSRVRLDSVDPSGIRSRAFEGPALLVSVQNGPRTGGSFLFAPQARTDDGQLEVVVAGDFNRLGTVGILPRVMRGTHLRHPKVHLFPARALTMTWSTEMPAHAEGERLEPALRFDIGLRPASLRVLAP